MGNASGNSPISPTVLTSISKKTQIADNNIILISGEGILVVSSGNRYIIAKPTPTSTNVIKGTLVGSSSGIWAKKINIAKAFTKPVITDLDTNFIKNPILAIPAAIWIKPARMVAANKYSKP